MDLKYLNTFKTILETGSFQSAARKLNYTQSTVTFQIQQLEQELSVKLFEKIGRKMVITQAGKDILPNIDTIVQSVEQLCNYGKDMRELTGMLRIAMPETLLTYQMQPVLKKFRQEAPNVKLSVQVLNCIIIREQLINGDADIGVHYDVGGYGPTVISEKMTDFPLALTASPLLNNSLTDFTTSKQRKSLCMITNDRGSVFQMIFDDYLKEREIVLEENMELESIEAIKRCVMSNLGVAYLPRYVVEKELGEGTLKELKVEISNKVITAIFAYHKNKWISPPMELFLKLLHEKLWDVA